MSRAIKKWSYGAALVSLLVLVVLVSVSATNYNAWSEKTCSDAGLTWVKEYPYGGYGCAEIIPFDEVGGVR